MKSETENLQYKINAYHIAERINLKQFKADFTGSFISGSPSELFYRIGDDGYLYLLNYGVIVLANIDEIESTRIFNLMSDYCDSLLPERIEDNFIVNYVPDHKTSVEFDSLTVGRIDEEILQVVMFNVSQSVALDYFDRLSENLLKEVKSITVELETHGRVKISKKNMIKFVGRSLNAKNKIVENLSLFSVADLVWEDKELETINSGLTRLFDLKVRVKELENKFKNIEDNLTIVRDVYHQRESNMLEWIIIILILIEVINLFVSKITWLFK